MDSTIIALCAAIDAGDDTALHALADALKEMDDPRAAGLRRAIRDGDLWKIEPSESRNYVPPLKGRWMIGCWDCGGPTWVGWQLFLEDFPTRSAAFLALAEAIAKVKSKIAQSL